MAHDKDIDTSFISNPHVAHEESDVKVRPILMFVVWLTVGTIVVFFLMGALFNYLDGKAKDEDQRARSPLADERNPIPPKPLLQMAPAKPSKPDNKLEPDNNSPLSEVISVRKGEELKLDSYTWVDQSKGVVELPIERAKELALERGILKSRPPAPPAAAPAAVDTATPAANRSPAGSPANAPARPASNGTRPPPQEKKQP